MIHKLVRQTCDFVVQHAQHVKIDDDAIEAICSSINKKPEYVDYFDGHHLDRASDPETIAAYVFVIDALNFCFWPSNWEYCDLSKAVNDAFTKNPEFKTAKKMAEIGFEDFKQLVFGGLDFPLIQERHRAINEVGTVILQRYQGSFLQFLKQAEFDAPRLLDQVAREFLMFQDHAIYQGHQVYFYKRAQILVGDLFGAFRQAKTADQIANVDQLTCFADYRIPQIMRARGVLRYSEQLSKQIDEKQELVYGSPAEVEIRACMVQAVERIRDVLRKKGVAWTAVEVDWLLWQIGEEQKDEIPAHHRTLSIFY